jgi:hypothetical protein
MNLGFRVVAFFFIENVVIQKPVRKVDLQSVAVHTNFNSGPDWTKNMYFAFFAPLRLCVGSSLDPLRRECKTWVTVVARMHRAVPGDRNDPAPFLWASDVGQGR